jgi:hypothetical protein
MRLHAMHVQGLRAARDIQHLSFDSRYNAVIAPDLDTALALHELLLSLLFPESELAHTEPIGEQKGELPPRAALALRLDTQELRVLLDLSKPRAALGRFDPVDRVYRPVATRLPEIGAALRAAGRPERSTFEALYQLPLGLSDASSSPSAELDREASEARWLALRAAHHRIRVLERESRKLEAALAGKGALGDALDGLPDALERYRAFVAERERELRELELERGRLLEERSRIRAVPSAQRPVVGLGLALAAAATLAGWLAHPAVYLAVPLGLLAATLAAIGAARARRRIGRIDAQLAALRMREESLERRFEAEVVDVRTLMQALALDSIEGLEDEARAHRGRLERRSALDAELRAARLAFPDQAGEELQRLDAKLLRAEKGGPGGNADDPLARRFESVTAAGLIAPEALESRVRAIAPLYLRALTHGQVSGLARDLPGFALECKEESEPKLAHALEPSLRAQVTLGFELALAECLAPGVRAPLLVSPGASPEREEDARALARALLRLSSARQIVQITPAADPFTELATRVHTLG